MIKEKKSKLPIFFERERRIAEREGKKRKEKKRKEKRGERKGKERKKKKSLYFHFLFFCIFGLSILVIKLEKDVNFHIFLQLLIYVQLCFDIFNQ